MRVYQHRETDAVHNYNVWYVSEDCTKQVNKDKPDYITWIADGNTPEVIPYVAPTPIPLETLRLQAIDLSVTRRATALASGFTFQSNVYDTTASSRELISYGFQIAQTKDETYTRTYVLKDGSQVVLTKAEIIALYAGILAWGETGYDAWLAVYDGLLVADRATLEAYIAGE